MAGGKRIRPHLTIVGYGSADDRIIPVAAAQELIHIAMLMHDDIIDQDDMRHGIANINGRYSTHYREYVSPQRAMHYANSAGILAGDCMLSEAYQVISSSSFDASVTRKLINQLHLSIFEVIGGELLDVEASFVQGVDFDPLKIYRYKTASYSFIGPLISGAYCAGTDEREVEKLRTFATNLGIAFQIQDDLLGVFGDEQETGMSSLSDLREGKETLLVRFHRQLMDEEMRERFMEFGNENTSLSALASIRNDMRESSVQQKMTDVAEQ